MADEAGTFTVFLRDPGNALDERVIGALAAVRGVKALDVRKHLVECNGVLADDLERPQAAALVGALKKHGITTHTWSNDKVLRFPDPMRVGAAKPIPEGWSWRTEERTGDTPARAWLPVPWENLIYIAWARVRESETITEATVVPGDVHFVGMRGAARGSPRVEHKKKERLTKNQYIDFFAIHPAMHLRIDPMRFAFAGVLGKPAVSRHENICALVRGMIGKAPRVVLDPSIDDLLDGNPQTNLDLPSKRAYGLYLLWHIQMAFRKRRE